jgi:hypothetical protein
MRRVTVHHEELWPNPRHGGIFFTWCGTVRSITPHTPNEIKEILASMGLSLGMKIDDQGNAVPGPTSQMPSAVSMGGGMLDEPGDGQEF